MEEAGHDDFARERFSALTRWLNDDEENAARVLADVIPEPAGDPADLIDNFDDL